LPQRINDTTRLDDTSRDGLSIVYHYTALNITAGLHDMRGFEQAYRQEIIEAVCNLPATRSLLQEGVGVTHQYISSDEVFLGNFPVALKDCAAQ
jgi:hypothetical protein